MKVGDIVKRKYGGGSAFIIAKTKNSTGENLVQKITQNAVNLMQFFYHLQSVPTEITDSQLTYTVSYKFAF